MEYTHNEVSPTQCVDCSIYLPLHVSQAPGSVRVRCRFCGSVYRGVLLPDSERAPLVNVEVVDDSEFFGSMPD